MLILTISVKRIEEKLPQDFITDFYNLHLQSGPKYDKTEIKNMRAIKKCRNAIKAPYEELPNVVKDRPDQNEQKRIKHFLEKCHARLGPDLDFLKDIRYFSKLDKISWFESRYFLQFADDYHYVAQTIDKYIAGEVSSFELGWLESMRKSFESEPCLKVASIKDKDKVYRVDNPVLFDDVIMSWNLNDYRVEERYDEWNLRTDKGGRIYYGISTLYQLMDQVIIGVRDMITEHWKIDRCQLEGCENIFVLRPSGKTQKYCSNTHRVRAFREMKKEILAL